MAGMLRNENEGGRENDACHAGCVWGQGREAGGGEGGVDGGL